MRGEGLFPGDITLSEERPPANRGAPDGEKVQGEAGSGKHAVHLVNGNTIDSRASLPLWRMLKKSNKRVYAWCGANKKKG